MEKLKGVPTGSSQTKYGPSRNNTTVLLVMQYTVSEVAFLWDDRVSNPGRNLSALFRSVPLWRLQQSLTPRQCWGVSAVQRPKIPLVWDMTRGHVPHRPAGSHHKIITLTPRCIAILETPSVPQLGKLFPRTFCNPQVHYLVHRRPPPVPILRRLNPLHTPIIFKIHFSFPQCNNKERNSPSIMSPGLRN